LAAGAQDQGVVARTILRPQHATCAVIADGAHRRCCRNFRARASLRHGSNLFVAVFFCNFFTSPSSSFFFTRII
jgi:hypothetical protein